MLSSKIINIWKRSSNAEGNPLHVCFSREKYSNVEEIKVLEDGLVDSFDWHRDKQVKSREAAGKCPNDRAILIQNKENLKILKEKFPDVNTFDLDSPFGENIDLEGSFTPNNLCIGDILEIIRDNSVVCVLQVTSPRWPCYKIG